MSKKISCKICGKELKMITYLHLKMHNISINDYKQKFGLTSKELGYTCKWKNKHSIDFYKDKEKYIERIHKALKGRISSNKDKKMSEEQKQKISKSNKGKKRTKQQCKKISVSHLGIQAWNKGLNKNNDKRVKKYADKLINHTISKRTKNKIKKSVLRYYKNMTESERKKFLETQRRISANNIGRKRSKETIEKMSIAAIKRLSEHPQQMPFSNTKPERELKKILEKYNIKYIHQYPVLNIKHRLCADFYLPEYNLIIETDGIYWHNYPNGKEIDKIRNKEMIEVGYKVLRLWETEVKNEKNVLLKINERIRKGFDSLCQVG